MKKDKKVIVRDSQDLQNLLIQANLKNNTVTVLSSLSAWENLAFIMEALGVTVEKCVEEGIEKEKVESAINDYLKKVLGSYRIIK